MTIPAKKLHQEWMQDPAYREAYEALAELAGLPEDDEPEAPEEADAVAAAKDEAGPNVSAAEARRRFRG